MSSESVSGSAATVGEAMRAYQASVDDFDRETARVLGINETDLRCLETLLQEVPEATPRQLADRLGLTTGSVTTMLDRLEKAGYLTRSPHPGDRRKLIVRATEAARQRAGELMAPLIAEGNEHLLSRYSPEELDLITEFLVSVRDLQEAHVQRLRQCQPFS